MYARIPAPAIEKQHLDDDTEKFDVIEEFIVAAPDKHQYAMRPVSQDKGGAHMNQVSMIQPVGIE